MIPPTPCSSSEESTPLILTANALKENSIYVYLAAFLSAIGGFLFGYDTGIISGAMIFIRDVFQLNELWQESIVSSTLLAAWVFSILAGSATNKLGRKVVILASSLFFVAGSLLLSWAWNELVLLLGRVVVGAGVGLASMSVPMYIAEVAPSNIRGKLVLINICCITGGQFLSSLIAYWFSFIEGDDGWRYMLGFAAVPAAIQFFAFLFMPESPRWLIGVKRYDEAKRVLRKIRPKGADIEAEFNAIKQNDLAHERMEAQHESLQLSVSSSGSSRKPQTTFARILRNTPVRRALVVGCLLQIIQQFSGINTVMYYTASIFEMSGVYSKQTALLLSAGASSVNFIFTIVGYYLVERAGRRSLTLYSLFGVIVSLVILGAGFQFAYLNSPKVTEVDHSDLNHPCDTLNDCSACSLLPQCGFCFAVTPNSNQVFGASCLHVNSSHQDRSALGVCQTGSTQDYMWAYEWCPSAYSWVTMVGMVLYLLSFAPGMGPMPWTINSEIYPQWARSWCLSATTSVNWLFNLLMSMTFLSLTRAITKFGAFYLYAFLSSLGFVYFYFVLPETKGKTLEELEDLFADKKQLATEEDANGNETRIESGRNKIV